MKKLISILAIIFSLCTSLAFADKSRFYENGKVIDTMYVDSPEGLRVRSAPSLKSNRICGLTHRVPVKIVAIGNEDTIDGITAPWVEILVPRYEWKGENPEYGWIFGGYIKKEQPKFIAPKNAQEFKQYLESSYWEFFFEDGDSCLSYCGYFENGKLYAYQEPYTTGSEKCFSSFEAVGKNVFYSNGYSWYGRPCPGADECEQYLFLPGKTKLDSIEENSMNIHCSSYPKGMHVFDFTALKNYLGKINLGFGKIVNFDFNMMLKDKRLYAVVWDENVIQNFIREEIDKSDNIKQFIKSGISAKDTKYEEQYHDYWNPIMTEHQKKADEMQ